jgi:hypothetical protein
MRYVTLKPWSCASPGGRTATIDPDFAESLPAEWGKQLGQVIRAGCFYAELGGSQAIVRFRQKARGSLEKVPERVL